MFRRAKTDALPLLICGLLAWPAAAAAAGAGDGGDGLSPSPGDSGQTGSGNTGSTTEAQPVGGPVRASGNGITVSTSPAALLRRPLRFSGTVTNTPRGWVVEIERRLRGSHGGWEPTTHGTVASDGSFTAVWPANHAGRFEVRAVPERAPGAAARAGAARATPPLTVTIYRPAIATTYGPGFFGSRTACGQILRRSTLGVAHRTLPCGTRVSLLWHGRTLVVPVIDRGPYANHADWDLTSATARAMGIDGTETIGAVPLRR